MCRAGGIGCAVGLRELEKADHIVQKKPHSGPVWQFRGSPVLRADKLLKVDVLQVHGAAVPAIQKPGAQQVGQTRTGVVLAFPEERDLGKEESESFP